MRCREEASEMSFIAHLEALRRVLIRSGWGLLVLFPVFAYWAGDLVDLLIRYTCPAGLELKYFSPMEPLWVQLKVALLASLVVGLPYFAWQIWGFVVPGLYERERRFFFRLAAVSWLVFLLGGVFAIEFILPLMMKFSLGLQSASVKPVIGLENFVGMTGLLLL
ncbi:MAG: twin-arginine translocase subunit TatC, partial [Victivallales bacterium]|nr:twin-arginine translocase subunit TatC [Victivallales bacterium]